MPGVPTPNLGLTVPTVGGDSGAWGPEVNTNWTILDGISAYAPISMSASGSIVLVSPIPPITVILATGGVAGISLNLPIPSLFTGRIITVKKMDSGAGAVTLVPLVGAIDGFPNWVLSGQYQYVSLYSDGVNLDVVANN